MNNNTSGKPNCPICLNDITNPFYAHANNNGRRHPFHKQCLKRYIKSGRNLCPVCRVNLSRNNIQNILTPIVGPNANNYNQLVNSNANNNGNNGNNGRSNNNGNNGGSNNNVFIGPITLENQNFMNSYNWLYENTSWFVPSRGLLHTIRPELSRIAQNAHNSPRNMWDLLDWITEIETTIFNYVMDNNILHRFIGPIRRQALPTMNRFFDWLPDEDRARCYAYYYGSNNGSNTLISQVSRQAYVDLIPQYIEYTPNRGAFRV